ncbi:MAG: SpoIIE family protein phosphatase [Planctomycetota bacterium]|nr:SpoIIE family protein phosphatase [Planctomycetota bacterium]
MAGATAAGALTMARKNSKGGRSTGSIARTLALPMAAVGLFCGLLVTAVLIQSLGSAARGGWTMGLIMAGFAGILCAIAGWVFGGRIGHRITDIGLAVSKLGRGSSEVRVRLSGNDEATMLGRSLQYLANDLADLWKSQESAGGASHVSMDPLVKQLRDKTVPAKLPAVPGYEVDGALSNGSRGGLDYFDLVPGQGEDGSAVIYVVSADGHGALAVVACRQARDELHRALQAGANPRKALAHTNKVLKQSLPSGCCAKATLLQVTAEGCKLYQAGARSPLLICQRGEVLELNAEGIALGLDDGPVFEKSLRPEEIAMNPGTRLVLGNDALHRAEGLLDLLRQHSPRHTNMFMNVVLGGIEQDAGADGLREDVVLITVKKAGQA